MSVFDFPANKTIIRKAALKIMHRLTWSGWEVQKWDMAASICPSYIVLQGVKKDKRHIYILPYAMTSPSMNNDVPEVGLRRLECFDFLKFKELVTKKQPAWNAKFYIVVFVDTSGQLFCMDVETVVKSGRPYLPELIHKGGTLFIRLEAMVNVTGEFEGVWLNVEE